MSVKRADHAAIGQRQLAHGGLHQRAIVLDHFADQGGRDQQDP
jgi:hypothetical protein